VLCNCVDIPAKTKYSNLSHTGFDLLVHDIIGGRTSVPELTKYRIFISFSHTEAKLLQMVREHLERILSCEVRCSDTLRPGTGFNQQIKEEIARAHLFIPIITKAANERGWVHQEIGYAMSSSSGKTRLPASEVRCVERFGLEPCP
jgi:hypothetical protein